MSSKSKSPFTSRAERHRHALAKRLFKLASTKKSNLVLSLDVTTTADLLRIADLLGPHIVVLKTHIDIISDFSDATIAGLRRLGQKHDFLLFEDRKFVDIGSTVQKQYAGGALHIADWAHIVNCAILAGPGIVDALEKSAKGLDQGLEHDGGRALLILAEMTSAGSLATGPYTAASVDVARRHADFVLGFVATRELSAVSGTESAAAEGEDFLVFTTGVNMATSGDSLGQQYQTPQSAVQGGADFIIAGRGIYAAKDPVEAAKRYQKAGWSAYLERIGE